MATSYTLTVGDLHLIFNTDISVLTSWSLHMYYALPTCQVLTLSIYPQDSFNNLYSTLCQSFSVAHNVELHAKVPNTSFSYTLDFSFLRHSCSSSSTWCTHSFLDLLLLLFYDSGVWVKPFVCIIELSSLDISGFYLFFSFFFWAGCAGSRGELINRPQFLWTSAFIHGLIELSMNALSVLLI